jgi:DNA-binding NtrC family response regulator
MEGFMSPEPIWSPIAACDNARVCILVVEDEMLIRFMLSDCLRDYGYRVIEACNADEALVILETAVPQLIITDVRMPGSMDGLGLLAAVTRTLPEVPVIVTSAHFNPGAAIAEGAAKFFSKPYSMDAMIDVVRGELTPND